MSSSEEQIVEATGAPFRAPQGFAADADPPYGEDVDPPTFEPIRLPWECVEDSVDERLSQARVLNADNELVCTTTLRRARLIVSVVNRHASGWDAAAPPASVPSPPEPAA